MVDHYSNILRLRHRWKTVPEVYCIWVCPSVSERVSESVRPENLMNTISQKTYKGNFTQFWSLMQLGS